MPRITYHTPDSDLAWFESLPPRSIAAEGGLVPLDERQRLESKAYVQDDVLRVDTPSAPHLPQLLRLGAAHRFPMPLTLA